MIAGFDHSSGLLRPSDLQERVYHITSGKSSPNSRK
jgi:hypothetical protein